MILLPFSMFSTSFLSEAGECESWFWSDAGQIEKSEQEKKDQFIVQIF